MEYLPREKSRNSADTTRNSLKDQDSDISRASRHLPASSFVTLSPWSQISPQFYLRLILGQPDRPAPCSFGMCHSSTLSPSHTPAIQLLILPRLLEETQTLKETHQFSPSALTVIFKFCNVRVSGAASQIEFKCAIFVFLFPKHDSPRKGVMLFRNCRP